MIKSITDITHMSTGMGVVAILLHIGIGAAIAFFIYTIANYLRVHNTFAKIAAKAKHDIKEQDRLKNEEYKRQFEMEGATEDKKRDSYKKTAKILQDSGIKARIPEITPTVFMIIVATICVTSGIVGFFITKNVFLSLAFAVGAYVIIRFYLEIQISRNYRQLESEAIKFVNLLRNNSHIESSLGEMLGRTIPYISGNLKASVEKCYYEIKSTGNVVLSLEHLCQRTSYQKLREVFEALKICATHSEDYEQVIDEASDSLASYIEYRNEVASLKKNNLIDLLFITGAGLLILIEMKTMLTDIDVEYYLFRTLIGQILCIVLAVITVLGLFQFVKSDED